MKELCNLRALLRVGLTVRISQEEPGGPVVLALDDHKRTVELSENELVQVLAGVADAPGALSPIPEPPGGAPMGIYGFVHRGDAADE